jgi:hypothetical protein
MEGFHEKVVEVLKVPAYQQLYALSQSCSMAKKIERTCTIESNFETLVGNGADQDVNPMG